MQDSDDELVPLSCDLDEQLSGEICASGEAHLIKVESPQLWVDFNGWKKEKGLSRWLVRPSPNRAWNPMHKATVGLRDMYKSIAKTKKGGGLHRRRRQQMTGLTHSTFLPAPPPNCININL